MAIVPLDSAHFTIALQNDAQYWRTVIEWARTRYPVYTQNCTAANMTTAGISSADQAIVLAFIADLSRFVTLSQGTIPGSAADMAFDVNAIFGMV